MGGVVCQKIVPNRGNVCFGAGIFGQGALKQFVDAVADKKTVFVGVVRREMTLSECKIGGGGKVGYSV